VVLFYLYKHRDRLDADSVYARFGMWYIRYKFNLFFWEMIIMGRKLGVVAMSLFFNKSPATQAVISIISIGAFTALQIWQRPYLLRRHNIQETVLLCVALVFQLFGVIYYATEFSESGMNAIVILLLSASTIYILVLFAIDTMAQIKIYRKSFNNNYEMDEEEQKQSP